MDDIIRPNTSNMTMCLSRRWQRLAYSTKSSNFLHWHRWFIVSKRNLACVSSGKRTLSVVLAKSLLVIAQWLQENFPRNDINNIPENFKLLRFVQRLLKTFPKRLLSASKRCGQGACRGQVDQRSLDSTSPNPAKPNENIRKRRAGWKTFWNVRKSQIEVQEGPRSQIGIARGSELRRNIRDNQPQSR
jgi:hypothetical protein